MTESIGIKHVSSRDNPLVQRVRRLARENTAYRELGQVWLEGEHLCSAYLARGGRPRQVLCAASAHAAGTHAALCAPAPVTVLPDALFKALSGVEAPTGLGYLIDLPAPTAVRPSVNTVVLDRLQDAGNVGAILRSASAFGVRQVLALKGTAALWSPKVLRAGMGAHFGLHLVEGLPLGELDALTLPLVATSSHAEQALHRVQLPDPCAWVLGHEGQGVAPELLQRCALTITIPQPGGEESLNVASAAAVCLYEAARQRLV
jgi:RNA methyltransferase, TrmH family